MQSHKSELTSIRALARLLGGCANVTHQGPGPRSRNGYRGIWGTPGIPDLYIQLPARPGLGVPICYWHEVKVGRDSLRNDQRAFIEREMSAAGLPVLVGDCRDMETMLGVGRGFCADPERLRRQIRDLADAGKLWIPARSALLTALTAFCVGG